MFKKSTSICVGDTPSKRPGIADHPKEEIQMTNKYLRKCSIFTSEKCKLKLLRFHLIPVRIMKTTNNKCRQGCGERGLYYTAGGLRNWSSPYEISWEVTQKNGKGTTVQPKGIQVSTTEMRVRLCLLLPCSHEPRWPSAQGSEAEGIDVYSEILCSHKEK